MIRTNDLSRTLATEVNQSISVVGKSPSVLPDLQKWKRSTQQLDIKNRC